MFSVYKRLGSTKAEVSIVIQKRWKQEGSPKRPSFRLAGSISVSAWESIHLRCLYLDSFQTGCSTPVDRVIPRTATASTPLNVLSRAD